MIFLRILGVVILCGIATQAAAQFPTYNPPQPQQPNQQAYAAQAQIFPKLPPSRACTSNDLLGMWKLLLMYETPVGSDMTEFLTYPVQYLLFNGDNTYGKVNTRNEMPPMAVRSGVAKGEGLRQYLVDATGFIFFYANKQVIDTQACFIVATQQDAFIPGQMLLMPPQGQSKERLLKIYNKINENRR